MTYHNVVFPDRLLWEALGGTQIPGEAPFVEYAWDLYQLETEYRVIWHEGVITAPAMMITDRSSIPGLAQGLIQKDGPHQPGSIIHDWVFLNKGVPGCKTFEDANDLFFECMRAKGSSRIERNIIFGAVNSDIGRAIWDDDK